MEACFPCLGVGKSRVPPGDPHHSLVAAAARTFSFEELAAATRNFSDDFLVAAKEAGLYKGYLKSVNQVVAIKLKHAADDRGSSERCNREFLAHVLKLSALRHPNLLNLIGFCTDGKHRILVHEYMPLGSLEDHLHDPSPDKARLDWNTRMSIAAGVAGGLEYLHDKGVVYRGMRSSDILLGDGDGDGVGYHPKLSQYRLAKAGQLPHNGIVKHAATLSPETAMTGMLSSASDVYSFGVVLLEMITGRRAFVAEAAVKDANLVSWARPLLKDRAEFRRMADPALEGRYPLMDLEEALAVASMCVHQTPAMRSPIGAVVTALARLAYNRSS